MTGTGLTADEIRERYERLQDRYPLRLAWQDGPPHGEAAAPAQAPA